MLHNLAPFAQFKKCEKHLWRSITFSKLQACTNGIKSLKASEINKPDDVTCLSSNDFSQLKLLIARLISFSLAFYNPK